MARALPEIWDFGTSTAAKWTARELREYFRFNESGYVRNIGDLAVVLARCLNEIIAINFWVSGRRIVLDCPGICSSTLQLDIVNVPYQVALTSLMT
jgi:hypothetical protein